MKKITIIALINILIVPLYILISGNRLVLQHYFPDKNAEVTDIIVYGPYILAIICVGISVILIRQNKERLAITIGILPPIITFLGISIIWFLKI